MGFLGSGPFDNDPAVDWLIELDDEPSLDAVRDALVAVALAPAGADFDVDEGAEAIAAAEVLAQIVGWAGEQRALRLRAAKKLAKALEREPGARTVWLLTHALAAVERAANDEDSELQQIWDDADKKQKAAWRRGVKDLVARLKKAMAKLGARARKKRPAGVPKEAIFDPEDHEWFVVPKRKRRKHGEERRWRADGTLASTCVFVDGVPHGPYQRFHESGEVSREGTYADGKFDGVDVFLRTEHPTSEVAFDRDPKAIVRSEFAYRAGCLIASRWLDRKRRRLTPHGKPYPRRPAGVPDEACYEAGWFDGVTDEALMRHGTWRFWNERGALILEIDYAHGEEVARRAT